MSRVTRKGQVTIPKPLRDALGIKPGMRVQFGADRGPPVTLTIVKATPKPNPFEKWRGTIDLDGMSTDEFMKFLRGDPADDPD